MTFADEVREQKSRQQKELEQMIKNYQAYCPHDVVGHYDGFSTYGTYCPRRICTECGFEEEGGWWCYSVDCSHWHSNEDRTGTKLGPREGRTFFKVSDDELRRYRP